MTKTATRIAAFDMDGTIIDSMPMLTELGVQSIMTHYKLTRQVARSAYESTVGMPFAQQLDALYPDDARNTEAAASYAATHRAVAPLFPVAFGFSSLLRRITCDGWLAVLVSSTHRSIIQIMPQIQELWFTRVIGFKHGCSKREQIREFAGDYAEIPFDREHVIYFGDALFDSELAAELGIRFQYATPSSITAVANIIVEDASRESLARVA